MNPPANDPHLSERAADTIELLVKTGGLLGMAWAFMAKVLKPYHEHRRAAFARTIREVMVPVLQPILADHDVLLEIALDNRERHDETNELLDLLGFSSDRRAHQEERRAHLTEMVESLAERRRERRRTLDS